MKDLPITLRMGILVSLVLSLLAILWQIVAEPTEVLHPAAIATNEEATTEKPVPPVAVFYPPVPAVLPDLNEGYLFNSTRSFTEIESDLPGAASNLVDLSEVSYVGSLIVGDLHKGLIIYHEKIPARRQTSPTSRRAARQRKPVVKTVAKHKLLVLGEKFMGYIVEKIEKDRIVFKNGDEIVEKFLYDQNKKRVTVVSAAKSQAAKVAIRAAQQAPVQRSVSRSTQNIAKKAADVKVSRVAPQPITTPPPAKVIKKRSERLLGIADPSLGLPGIPGDPLGR